MATYSLTVAHFPSIDALSANPYWPLLRDGLAEQGVLTVNPLGVFGRRWLLRNVRKVNVLHFHFVQQFYAYENTHARLRWVLRLASNLVLARMLGYCTVFTLHDLLPTWPLEPPWVDYMGHRVAVQLVNSVIVHCRAAAEALAARYGRHRGVYIVTHPNYIGSYPAQIPQQEARAQLGLRPDQLVFLFFGGLRPNKGIDGLINAFQQLPGQHLALLVAGKPWPPAAYCARLRALAATDARICLLDRFIEEREVAVLMGAADVVVLPFSRILSSSSTILAMGFGRPVVVPAMGCLVELVGSSCGVLYDPAEHNALLRALVRCTQLDLRSMGIRARERVEAFTIERFAAETVRAYVGVAQRSPTLGAAAQGRSL